MFLEGSNTNAGTSPVGRVGVLTLVAQTKPSSTGEKVAGQNDAHLPKLHHREHDQVAWRVQPYTARTRGICVLSLVCAISRTTYLIFRVFGASVAFKKQSHVEVGDSRFGCTGCTSLTLTCNARSDHSLQSQGLQLHFRPRYPVEGAFTLSKPTITYHY